MPKKLWRPEQFTQQQHETKQRPIDRKSAARQGTDQKTTGPRPAEYRQKFHRYPRTITEKIMPHTRVCKVVVGPIVYVQPDINGAPIGHTSGNKAEYHPNRND
jgi:hypothetical protein